MLVAEDQKRLEMLYNKVKDNTKNFVGFPVSKDFNYKELMPFLEFPMNNLGDSFTPSTYGVDSREMETEVVSYFADLFRAPKNDWWGYVTNGGSEGKK